MCFTSYAQIFNKLRVALLIKEHCHLHFIITVKWVYLNSFYHQYSFHRCTCGNCSTGLLQNAKECCCCLEIENCLQFIEVYCKDGEGALKCITDHPGFPAVCLNKWSLEIAAVNYKTRDGRRYRQSGSKER